MPTDRTPLTQDEHHEYIIQRCESFARERESHISSLLSISERFDKWVIGLPAGAAGLTLLFYEKVVANAGKVSLGALALSWICLGFAIGVGFLSLYFSTLAVQRQIEIGDDEHEDFLKNSTPNKPEGVKRRKTLENRWSTATHRSNLVSVLASLAGISAFLYFAYKVAENPPNSPPKKDEQRQGQTNGEEGGLRTSEERSPDAPTSEGHTGGIRSSEESSTKTAKEVSEQGGAGEPAAASEPNSPNLPPKKDEQRQRQTTGEQGGLRASEERSPDTPAAE
jgi:hypothetical protein